MNVPPFPKNPMLLQAPDYNRYMFRRKHRNGLIEWFFFVNGWQYSYWKKTEAETHLTPEEAEKLARNLWREIFGDGEQYV
jgi:hypothetical protein